MTVRCEKVRTRVLKNKRFHFRTEQEVPPTRVLGGLSQLISSKPFWGSSRLLFVRKRPNGAGKTKRIPIG